jgi:integrase
MAKLTKRITDNLVRTLPLPEPLTDKAAMPGAMIKPSTAAHEYYWCPFTPGFGVRVSSTGDKAYIAERRNTDGKTRRKTLGKAVGAKSISADAARALQIAFSSEVQTGVEHSKVKREQRKVEKAEAVTFGEALKAYVKGKRRAKDGLPLKDRTKTDYLKMISHGGVRAIRKDGTGGEPFLDGPLYELTDKPMTKIRADDIRRVYKATEKRSLRQATYAMQVLRAVLNWYGIQVDESPLAKTTAGRDRIILAPTAGDPHPIPPEKLGPWWKVATAHAGGAAADGCRFILLTGSRPGEVFGSKGEGWDEPGLLVRNVDIAGARLIFLDTKNRKNHTVALSTQALQIVKAHCEGKKPYKKVFDVGDPGKTLETINAEADVDDITPHRLRHTFVSVSEELVSGYALKRMINHSDANDVTGNNYVGKSESQMRVAWQTVADFIESSAKETP